jgi:ubiquinone/menaquinone biosynthesis C-methylase UbiE
MATTMQGKIHGMWASVATAWETNADVVDARSAALTERLLDLARPGPGERVLELASGPGGLGLAAAERVGPGGEVVISDVAAPMVAAARARAQARGLANVRARELDFESIDEPDESFDAVLCREGLMFAIEPARAAAEARRVLRPGGRAAVAVWGPRERNPWLGLMLDAVGEQLGETLPPPGMPGPFALSHAEGLHALLAGAGLVEVAVEEVDVPLRVPSAESWWERGISLAGPVARRLAGLSPEATAAARDQACAAVAAYAVGDGLEIPGVALVAHASRSSAAISSTP